MAVPDEITSFLGCVQLPEHWKMRQILRQPANFGKIFARCARQQILDQIFENTYLGQGVGGPGEAGGEAGGDAVGPSPDHTSLHGIGCPPEAKPHDERAPHPRSNRVTSLCSHQHWSTDHAMHVVGSVLM